MTTVPIEIVGFTNDSFLGFAAAELQDAYGNVHTFEGRVPLLTVDGGYLYANTSYPQPGELCCEVVKRWINDDGRELALIDTDKPYDIASITDEYRFVVLAEKVNYNT